MRLAEEIVQRVVQRSQEVWGRSLSKPIRLYLKVDRPESERRWPALWGIEGDSFGLGLQTQFDLESTWWNMEEGQGDALRSATESQRYLLVISHEISHLFMYPTPLRPWFQEAVAMNVGRAIAVSLDPTMAAYFPQRTDSVDCHAPLLIDRENLPIIDMESLATHTYVRIARSLEECRELQRKAYLFGRRLSIAQLIAWVSSVRDEAYDPSKDERSNHVIDSVLMKSLPRSS